MKTIALEHGGKTRRLTPDMRVLSQIEDEIAPLTLLCAEFETGAWRLTSLVAVVQMMLQSCGVTVDYRLLGDQILRSGVQRYAESVRAYLRCALGFAPETLQTP